MLDFNYSPVRSHVEFSVWLFVILMGYHIISLSSFSSVSHHTETSYGPLCPEGMAMFTICYHLWKRTATWAEDGEHLCVLGLILRQCLHIPVLFIA